MSSAIEIFAHFPKNACLCNANRPININADKSNVTKCRNQKRMENAISYHISVVKKQEILLKLELANRGLKFKVDKKWVKIVR